ncbi:MAG: DUF1259 domain-containing protein [Acidobacteriaceae bacterium]|nr:DUF1259 domain-containing protein [Acidobacteriaceae bacterium]
MNRLVRFYAPAITFCLFASLAAAGVSEEARTSIDHVIGHKGTYIPEEDVYKIMLPREAATIVQDYQRLSPNLGLNSWAAFISGVHHEAVLTGQFLLLDDEVNPALDAVLAAGLDVTRLAASCSFDGPHLYTLDVTGLSSFPTLAPAFRRVLDAIQRVRRTAAMSRKRAARPTIPLDSAINPGPLDAVLSMNGTVTAGVYKAAIGTRRLLNGEFVGREMGMSTWVSVAATNDHALAQGEFVESPNGLRKLLTALRAQGMNIASIRNHTLGEHPQSVFVRFWGEGTALQLAKAVRYALDVQVGAASPGPGEKI